jgi:hypothetical protein
MYLKGLNCVAKIFEGIDVTMTCDIATILNSTRSFLVASAHVFSK